MSLKTKAKFTSRRTYVVKLHSHASRDALTGRIENFVTGQQHEFTSSEELIASIVNDLDASESASNAQRDKR